MIHPNVFFWKWNQANVHLQKQKFTFVFVFCFAVSFHSSVTLIRKLGARTFWTQTIICESTFPKDSEGKLEASSLPSLKIFWRTVDFVVVLQVAEVVQRLELPAGTEAPAGSRTLMPFLDRWSWTDREPLSSQRDELLRCVLGSSVAVVSQLWGVTPCDKGLLSRRATSSTAAVHLQHLHVFHRPDSGWGPLYFHWLDSWRSAALKSCCHLTESPRFLKYLWTFLHREVRQEIWRRPSSASFLVVHQTNPAVLVDAGGIDQLLLSADGRRARSSPPAVLFDPPGPIYSLKYPVTLVYFGCICRTVQCKAA